MAYTTMKTWAALAVLTASEMNTYLRDNMDYVKDRLDGLALSGVTASRSASSQSIPNTTDTNIIFTSVSVEVNDWWTSGTNVIVPVGTVPGSATSVGALIFASIKYADNATGKRRVAIYRNGTLVSRKTVDAIGAGDDTDVETMSFTTMVDGDIFTLQAYQSSGGALNASLSHLSVIRLGPVD